MKNNFSFRLGLFFVQEGMGFDLAKTNQKKNPCDLLFKRGETMKLLKVMIVDDEILAIEHLKHMISWEEHGLTIVGEAASGKKAVEIAQNTRPHMIFMDIQMPRTNGLQVSQKILEFNTNTKIILLTSYRDFEYAKQAMSLGISTYLLKHELNERKLLETIKEIMTELQEHEQEVLSLKRQCLLDVLVTGSSKESAIKKLKKSIADLNSHYVCYFVKIDTAFPVFENFSFAVDDYIPELDLQGIFESEEMEYIESVTLEGGKLVVLCRLRVKSAEKEVYTTVYQKAMNIKQQGKQAGKSLSIMLSPVFNNLEELPALYRQLEKKSSNFVLYGKQSILRAQDIHLPDYDILEEWKGTIEYIRNQANTQVKEDFQQAIKVVFNRLKNKFHPSVLQVICKEFIFLLDQLRVKHRKPTYFEWSAEEEGDFPRFYFLDDIVKWLMEEYNHITSPSSHTSFSKKIHSVMAYIHEHYQNDISIEVIGEALSISGDHLRHLFKKETGRTVLDYVTWYRMEKAKNLLGREDYKIYEVAEMVGYKTSQYFSLVFKKYTGFTPYEFKEKNL